MFSVKKTVSGIFIIFSLWLTACGLPPGPNTAPDFATINSPTVILSNTTPIDSKNPQIAVDSTGIYVVWEDTTNSQILFSSSSNGGTSFQTISIPGSNGGTYPRLTTDGIGNAYVIWFSNAFPQSIYLNYAISNSFQNTVRVSSDTVPFPQYPVPQADLMFNSNTHSLFVTWSQCASNCLIDDIYYSTVLLSNTVTQTSITNSSFSKTTNISNTSSFAYYPKVISSGTSTNILYEMTNPSGLFLYNTTNGTQYTIGNSSVASNASLGIDRNGNSYAAWNPNNPPHDVFFNTLKSAESAFNTNNINLTNNSNSIGPVIGIDSSQYVYVAFFSIPSANPNAYDVFLERSADGGKSFSGALNVSNSTGDSASYAPGMAILGKTAYIVWDDNTNSTNHQIYFQKVTLN